MTCNTESMVTLKLIQICAFVWGIDTAGAAHLLWLTHSRTLEASISSAFPPTASFRANGTDLGLGKLGIASFWGHKVASKGHTVANHSWKTSIISLKHIIFVPSHSSNLLCILHTTTCKEGAWNSYPVGGYGCDQK